MRELDSRRLCGPLRPVFRVTKSPAGSSEERRIREEDEGGKEARGTQGRSDAKPGIILRTAGSAIIPRPFEFSSFVITTNTRQMKRAKGRTEGSGRKTRPTVGGKEERRRRAVINGVSAASESSGPDKISDGIPVAFILDFF